MDVEENFEDEDFDESGSSEDDELEDELIDVVNRGNNSDNEVELEEEYDDEDEDDEGDAEGNGAVNVTEKKGAKKNAQVAKGKSVATTAAPAQSTPDAPKRRRVNKVLLLASRGIIQRCLFPRYFSSSLRPCCGG